MECVNCCAEGRWSSMRAVLADETEVEIVLCDACRDALYTEEWIEIESTPAQSS